MLHAASCGRLIRVGCQFVYLAQAGTTAVFEVQPRNAVTATCRATRVCG